MVDLIKDLFGPQLLPGSCTVPGDRSTCERAELTLSAEIMNYVFYVFVPVKTVCFVIGIQGYV